MLKHTFIFDKWDLGHVTYQMLFTTSSERVWKNLKFLVIIFAYFHLGEVVWLSTEWRLRDKSRNLSTWSPPSSLDFQNIFEDWNHCDIYCLIRKELGYEFQNFFDQILSKNLIECFQPIQLISKIRRAFYIAMIAAIIQLVVVARGGDDLMSGEINLNQ